MNADHLRLLSFGAVETHQGPVDLKALGPFRTETSLSSTVIFLVVNRASINYSWILADLFLYKGSF